MKNNLTNHSNPFTVMRLNIQYIYHYYFLSHLFFFSPYIACKFFLDIAGSTEQIIGYTSILIWFTYGVYVTTQKIFVVVIGVVFCASQWAYYQGFTQLDVTLTLTCVVIMIIKQYQGRAYFALLFDIKSQRKKTS